MHIRKCEVCGATYSMTEYHLPVRDKDSLNCNYCGNELISWNSSTAFEYKEISGPTKSYKRTGIN